MLPPPNTETLDKACRFLNSVRGTDKVFMLVQYVSKLIIWRFSSSSEFVERVKNLATPVSDFRILLRYYGLLPLAQWIILSETNPPANPVLRLLTRLQNVTNLVYYPLEHIYWLSLHNVIKLSDSMRNKIGMWSCRFWAAYVVLYFVQLYQEAMMLVKRQRALTCSKKDEKELKLEKQAIQDEKQALFINGLINTAYFPLTVHWSLESSSFPDVAVGFCGTVAAVAQMYTAWKNA